MKFKEFNLLILIVLVVSGCENSEVSKLKRNILGRKILAYNYFDDCKIKTKKLEYSYVLYVECDSKIDEYGKYIKETYYPAAPDRTSARENRQLRRQRQFLQANALVLEPHGR